jgi:hypothetical protein
MMRNRSSKESSAVRIIPHSTVRVRFVSPSIITMTSHHRMDRRKFSGRRSNRRRRGQTWRGRRGLLQLETRRRRSR